MPISRFSAIISGACPAPLYDTVLLDTPNMVVTPTLGSIIPDWVLAIPKVHAVNVLAWATLKNLAPLQQVELISRSMGRALKDIIWFEHGPAATGAVTGCGVDHAHIHMLLRPPFSFDQFCKAARSEVALQWIEGTGDAYKALDPKTSYLVAGSCDRYLAARSVELAGSQFFRKVIACLIGRSDKWDYKSHPCLENVALTIAGRNQEAA
jgi:ATP adenylyltransferase